MPTLKVAGCWDMWLPPQQEWSTQWRFMLRHFGVEGQYMVPPNDVLTHPDAPELIQMITMEEVIESEPSLTPVIVDENATTSLTDFVHPTNALYIFGKVGWSPLQSLEGEYASVSIPSISGIAEPFLHPYQAASIVLYDRMIKSWQ